MTETAISSYTTEFNPRKSVLQPYKNDKQSNRYVNAQRIVSDSTSIEQINPYQYRVRSQSTDSFYTVTLYGNNQFACTCKDYNKNHRDCKHITAVRLNIGIPVDLRPYQVRDWKIYSQAQCDEGKFVKDYLKELSSTVSNPVRKQGGRPPIPYSEQVFNAVMKVYNGKSSRRSHSNTREYVETDYLTEEHHFNTPTKFLENPEATPILLNLIRMSALPLAEVEHSFSVDSSGFQTSKFGEWCDTKHGEVFTNKKGTRSMKARREHLWVKCHIISGNKTNIITDVIVTKSQGDGTGDKTNFIPLVTHTSKYFSMEEVCADAEYCTAENFICVEKADADAYIQFKKSNLGRNKAWARMYAFMIEHRWEYDEKANLRNNVESTFSALKQKMGEKLLSKNFVSQTNELLCKVLAYNLTVLGEAVSQYGVKI